jgi:hypothetical protein
MQNFKKILLPFKRGVSISKKQCPKTPQEEEQINAISYVLAVENIIYVMLCTRLDICFAIGIVSNYQLNSRSLHWVVVKHILK